MPTFTIAHLSDIHLSPLPKVSVNELMGKRILGYLNWHRKRKKIHLFAVLQKLIDDLKLQQPDHIVITGDLVNISTTLEFEIARRWLAHLGRSENVTIIPGNHDAYVPLAPGKGMDLLRDYMTDNLAGKELIHEIGLHEALTSDFPFIRRFGNIALVGLRSGIPTPPFMASGKLGEVQRKALRTILICLRRMNLFRVVLIHHPPLPWQTGWSRALRDGESLSALLRETGSELVLYGHLHRQSVARLESCGGDISILGVPSASRGMAGDETLARYNLLRIDTGKHNWTVDMIGRGLKTADGPVEELERRRVFELAYQDLNKF